MSLRSRIGDRRYRRLARRLHRIKAKLGMYDEPTVPEGWTVEPLDESFKVDHGDVTMFFEREWDGWFMSCAFGLDWEPAEEICDAMPFPMIQAAIDSAISILTDCPAWSPFTVLGGHVRCELGRSHPGQHQRDITPIEWFPHHHTTLTWGEGA